MLPFLYITSQGKIIHMPNSHIHACIFILKIGLKVWKIFKNLICRALLNVEFLVMLVDYWCTMISLSVNDL
jgi:hypothetical protein